MSTSASRSTSSDHRCGAATPTTSAPPGFPLVFDRVMRCTPACVDDAVIEQVVAIRPIAIVPAIGEGVGARRAGPQRREEGGLGRGLVGGRGDTHGPSAGERSSRPFGGDGQGRVLPRDEIRLADGERGELVPELLARVGHPTGRADEELVGQVGAGRGVIGARAGRRGRSGRGRRRSRRAARS